MRRTRPNTEGPVAYDNGAAPFSRRSAMRARWLRDCEALRLHRADRAADLLQAAAEIPPCTFSALTSGSPHAHRAFAHDHKPGRRPGVSWLHCSPAPEDEPWESSCRGDATAVKPSSVGTQTCVATVDPGAASKRVAARQ